MTKEFRDKILSGKVIKSSSLSVEDKKALYAIMGQYGMPVSTVYRRFFEKGFDEWEISGVTKLKEEFLSTVACPDGSGMDEDGSRGYAYVQTIADNYDDSRFFSLVTDFKIGVKLGEFMAERGMRSSLTVRRRFKANDWKPWELKGVRHILDELSENINEQNERK